MRVTVVRGMNSVSMEKYATEVVEGLRRFAGHIAVEEVRPVVESFPDIGGWLRKSRVYADRYLAYPSRVSRLKSDVYHITDHAHAHLIRGLNPARTVVTCHDLMALVHRERVGVNRVVAVGEWAFRYSINYLSRAARVVADSDKTKRDLVTCELCRPERIRVVHCGVSDVFQPLGGSADVDGLRRDMNLPGAHLILHVGSNASYKNVPGVLRVLSALLREARLDVRLVKVGLPFSTEQNSLIAELGLTERIVHLGMLSAPDLVRVYQCADVLLFPSFYEGFGWPPLEAMACGTPVVTSNAGSLPEVVCDAGVQVSAEDISGLARAVAAILTDRERRSMLVRKGLSQAGKFTLETSVESLVRVYAELAGDSVGSECTFNERAVG